MSSAKLCVHKRIGALALAATGRTNRSGPDVFGFAGDRYWVQINTEYVIIEISGENANKSVYFYHVKQIGKKTLKS